MPSPLTFGIFPGSVSGTENGLAAGAGDDPRYINQALNTLQSGKKQLLVRCYAPYTGPMLEGAAPYQGSPVQFEQYARNGRKLDLVLPFRHDDPDLSVWLQFVRGGYQAIWSTACEAPDYRRAQFYACARLGRWRLLPGSGSTCTGDQSRKGGGATGGM